MATPLGNMVVHLGLSDSGFEEKLQSATASLKSFKNDIGRLENQLKTDKAWSKYALNGRDAFKAYGSQVNTLNGLINRHSQYQSKLVNDYNRVQTGAKGLKQDVERLGTAYSKSKAETKANMEATQAWKQKLDEAKNSVDGSNKNIGALTKAYEQSREKTIASASATKALKEQLDSTKSSYESHTKQAESLANEYEKSQQKLYQYRGELSEAIKTQYSQYSVAARLGSGLTQVGNSLTTISEKTRGMTMAIGTGFAVSVKSAVEFEDGMRTIQALIADDVPANKMTSTMNTLSSAVKQYATDYGISTADIIDGMQEMIRRGYNVNQTMEAMPHVLQASKASGEAFGTVMHSTTAILEQFNLKAKDTQRVTDSLTFVANKTAADFSSLGVAMEYVGPMASTAGISLEQTAAAIGLLSQRGIEGEKAGTNLRNILTALVKPTDSQAAAFEKLGISTEDFKAGAISLADVLDLARTNTEGLTGAQKAALYSQAVGKTGQAGFNALIAQGGDALRNLTKETENAKGSTERMANSMMQSSKNQLAKAKAQIEVLGIEIGEELLPTINNLLKDGEKVIDWFRKLSPETKEAAVKFALATAAISPFTGVLGGMFKIVGGGLTGMAKLSGLTHDFVSKVKMLSSVQNSIGTLTQLGSTAVSTGTGMSKLTSIASAMGTVLSPMGIGAGLVATATLIGALTQPLRDAEQRTREWGTAVSSAEANSLSKFKAKVDETNEAMHLFGEGAGSVDAVKQAFSELADEVIRLNNDTLNKKIDLAEKFGLSESVIQGLKNNASKVEQNVQTMSDEVIAIYQKHNNDRQQLTEQEKAIVLNAQNEMINKQLELMNFSAKERKALQTAINGDLDSLNREQLNKALDNVEKMLDKEKSAYETKKKALNEVLKGLDESQVKEREEVLKQLETLESDHLAKNDAYADQYAKIQEKLLETSKMPAEAMELTRKEIAKTMAKYGINYEAAVARMNTAANKAVESNAMWAKSTADMSEQTKVANATWNSLTWKDGKLKTNAQEEIQKALKAENGWNNMKFVVQNANLESNAVFAVGEALIATGQWNALSPEDKKLIVDKSPAMAAINESTRSMQAWKEIPDVTKNFLANNSDFLNNTEVAKDTLANWNALKPEEKALTVKNLTSGDVTLAQNTINSLMGKNVDVTATDNVSGTAHMAKEAIDAVKQDQAVEIDASDNTGEAVLQANMKVNSVQQTSLPYINAFDNTGGSTSSAQAGISSVRQYGIPNILANNATGGATSSAQAGITSVRQYGIPNINANDMTAGPTSAAKGAIASVRGKTVTVSAADHASGVISGIAGWLSSLRDKTINIFTKHHNNEHGTNFHPGGLARVNDQKGAMYKELVTLPNGYSFIPQGRNVMLPLPRGSKVLTAARTKNLMNHMGVPKYAKGVGYSADSPLFKAMDSVDRKLSTPASVVMPDNTAVVALLAQVVELLQKGNKETPIVPVYLDGEMITKKVTEKQQFDAKIRNLVEGVPI